LRVELGGFPGSGGNADEMIAAGALDLATGKLLVALQMLVALGAGKFEFAHKFQFRSPGGETNMAAIQ
jgi:hypothetical protein